LVVSSHPPFAEGGHLVIAHNLVSALKAAGHHAEVMLTPQNRFGRQGAAYLATWLTDVGLAHDGVAIDQVISLRYPSYAVRHPRHVCWLNHTMREYYDLWEGFAAQLSWKNLLKERVRRRLMHAADRHLLTHGVRKLFVQSGTVNERLCQTLGVHGEVLYPPPPTRPYRCDGYEPFLLAVSRLTAHKRVDLVIRALAEPSASSVRAVVIGDGEARASLEALAVSLGVSTRVQWLGRVSDGVLLDHLARCRAVAFTPLSEDYGFVAAEAAAASKPVVTCGDSGGPAEVVQHEKTGLICEPRPDALAAAMARLLQDEDTARAWGAAAKSGPGAWSWEATVSSLLRV
jgi:glycosyltransferase involved in cell wall biosynthesis